MRPVTESPLPVEIVLMGSSAAWPIPRNRCRCPQCAEARAEPHLRRTRTGLLLRGPEGNLLLDASLDVYLQLDLLGEPAPADILVTHAHADHCLGLGDALVSGKGARRIHGHPSVLESLARLFPWALTGDVTTVPLAAGAPLRLGGLDLLPLDTFHSDPHGFKTLALLVSHAGRRVLLATDFLRLEDRDLERVAGADLWVMDGSGVDQAFPTHAPMSEILALRARTGGGPVLFTHLGHNRRTVAALLETLRGLGSSPVALARDGTRIRVDTAGVTLEGADGA